MFFEFLLSNALNEGDLYRKNPHKKTYSYGRSLLIPSSNPQSS